MLSDEFMIQLISKSSVKEEDVTVYRVVYLVVWKLYKFGRGWPRLSHCITEKFLDLGIRQRYTEI